MSTSSPAKELKERSLEVTPTFAVAAVVFVILSISIAIEHLLHLAGHWLQKHQKRALNEALEKIKAELMLLGFISLLLTVGQSPISQICVSSKVGSAWHPCDKTFEDSDYKDPCLKKGKVQLVSNYGIHQLHIFIFVLAVVHVIYCITTLVLGSLKMRKWKVWEDETKTVEYQYYNDPERFRFVRETSFGRRHLGFWSKSPTLLWIVCFFRQFLTSVAKVDYLTLRHGFIIAHLTPECHMRFNFQKYISRSLEEDFKVVVGISPVVWLFAVLLLLTYSHGWYSYLWLPFIPLVIILLVGTKLQMIITKMGLRAHDIGEIVKGTPLVRPDDELFWFGRPQLILLLINFVLFQNAFQLAFFIWSWYEFGFQSCYHRRREDIIIRISMGIIIQFLCSYVTLPLYALVTQMGSSMRPMIFSEPIVKALRSWHQTAKKNIKHSHHHSGHTSPLSSRPETPLQGSSPILLLHNYSRNHLDSLENSPRAQHYENEGRANEPSSHNHHNQVSEDYEIKGVPLDIEGGEIQEPGSTHFSEASHPDHSTRDPSELSFALDR